MDSTGCQMGATVVDTTRIAGRRKLSFASLDHISADVEKLAAGEVHTLGNWSGGQILKHLALTMTCSLDGFNVRLALPLRLLGKLMKRRLLTRDMKPGFQLTGPMARAILPPDPMEWTEGLTAIRTALQRLKVEPQRSPSPFLGALTIDEWTQHHCRHAE